MRFCATVESTRVSSWAASTPRWEATPTTETSPWFVTEADESDGSFALLEPSMAIVTNIENDHLTSDDELPGLVRAFASFSRKLPEDGLAVIGIDNPLSASLTSHDLRARVVTFGLDPAAWLRAANLRFAECRLASSTW